MHKVIETVFFSVGVVSIVAISFSALVVRVLAN
jgi:hypothetical protein